MKIDSKSKLVRKLKTYRDITKYLFDRRARGMKLGLEHIQALLMAIGHPEHNFLSIHIAGTNGKGSTAAILESILREAGYKTGLYTSPHLIDMRERIQIRGQYISKSDVISIVNKLQPHFETTSASFFECLTAMAFEHFSKNQIDIAVLETGLGGRLDATNTVTPILTIITPIGLDHTRILGTNILSVAYEKAGILKKNISCILGRQNPGVRQFYTDFGEEHQIPMQICQEDMKVTGIEATEKGSQFNLLTPQKQYKNLYLSLLGRHQIDNALSAIRACELLNEKGWDISENSIRKGLKKVTWPARLQLIQTKPKILLDSAHNPLGIKKLVHSLKTIFQYNRLILVFGILQDKDYPIIIKTIAPLADQIILTRPLSDRSLDPNELLKFKFLLEKHSLVIPDIEHAWNKAFQIAKTTDCICCVGSIYFIGELFRIQPEGLKITGN